MTAPTQGLLDAEEIERVFRDIKSRIQGNSNATAIVWSQGVLGEIHPNIERSLRSKFPGCDKGFREEKIAGLYAFWIAKLKPLFAVVEDYPAINEYAGLATGIAYVRDRLHLEIRLEKEEVLDMCDMLRYHTSSPHAMTNIFTLWVERERLKAKIPAPTA